LSHVVSSLLIVARKIQSGRGQRLRESGRAKNSEKRNTCERDADQPPHGGEVCRELKR